MKKTRKNKTSVFVRLLVASVALLLSLTLLSGCGSGDPYSDQIDDTWTIEALNVRIDVASDRTATVEEEFFITFNTYNKHGMYRDLAVNSGEKYRDVKVVEKKNGKEISVDYDFERPNGLLSVKIGSEDITYLPNKEVCFVIRYTLIPPKSADRDNYYMNAVGPAFSTDILSAYVEITMPAAIDSNKAYFYQGKYGENGSLPTPPVYTNENKTVSFSTALAPYEGVAFDLTFPKGTFGAHVDNEFYFTLFIGLALLAAAVALKLTVGRSKPVVPITNYYPPSDGGRKLSPVCLGMLIDNTCDNEDVTSLLFYWASQGYVRIGEQGGEMEITIVKPLSPDAPAYEHTMFDKLYSLASAVETDGENVDPFDGGDPAYTRKVTTGALKEKFYPAVGAVKAGVGAQYKGRLYDKKINLLSTLMGVLSGVFMVGMVLLAYMRISFKYINFWAFLAAVPILVVYLAGTYLANHYLKYSPAKRKAYVILYTLATLAAMAVASFFISADAMSVLEKCLLVGFTGLAAAVAPFITRRTEYYGRILGDVIGFKEFLTLAEKDKLEMLLEENPQYYYDVLPYANVLGVSDIWAKKFEDLSVAPPAYWNSSDVFTIMLFHSFYRRSYRSFSTVSTTRPSSSGHSGGGFSGGGGGGFSGGGFGGGGGRSW